MTDATREHGADEDADDSGSGRGDGEPIFYVESVGDGQGGYKNGFGFGLGNSLGSGYRLRNSPPEVREL